MCIIPQEKGGQGNTLERPTRGPRGTCGEKREEMSFVGWSEGRFGCVQSRGPNHSNQGCHHVLTQGQSICVVRSFVFLLFIAFPPRRRTMIRGPRPKVRSQFRFALLEEQREAAGQEPRAGPEVERLRSCVAEIEEALSDFVGGLDLTLQEWGALHSQHAQEWALYSEFQLVQFIGLSDLSSVHSCPARRVVASTQSSCRS